MLSESHVFFFTLVAIVFLHTSWSIHILYCHAPFFRFPSHLVLNLEFNHGSFFFKVRCVRLVDLCMSYLQMCEIIIISLLLVGKPFLPLLVS